MLVVTEKEALCALTLVASHGVDAHLLAPAVVVQTLIDICHNGAAEKRRQSGEGARWNLHK